MISESHILKCEGNGMRDWIRKQMIKRYLEEAEMMKRLLKKLPIDKESVLPVGGEATISLNYKERQQTQANCEQRIWRLW